MLQGRCSPYAYFADTVDFYSSVSASAKQVCGYLRSAGKILQQHDVRCVTGIGKVAEMPVVLNRGKQGVVVVEGKRCPRVTVLDPGVPLTSGQLMNHVWGYIPSAKSRTLHVHICWLRDLLEEDSAHPTLIQTIPHIGYRLANPT